MSLLVNHLHFQVSGKSIISDISVEFKSGNVTAIVGPNGSGKTSLLKLLSGHHSPSSGSVTLNGKDISRLPKPVLAQQLTVLPQSSPRPLGMRVYDVVASGRYPHLGTWKPFSQRDQLAVESALHKTNIWSLRDYPVDHLSGGEMQRVWLAMVLCQETPYILLDEPISYLDVAHQIALLDMVKYLNKEEGKTIIWVLHDLNQAMQYSDDICIVSQGKLVRHGAAGSVLDKKILNDVFGIETESVSVPQCKSPILVPIALSKSKLPVKNIDEAVVNTDSAA